MVVQADAVHYSRSAVHWKCGPQSVQNWLKADSSGHREVSREFAHSKQVAVPAAAAVAQVLCRWVAHTGV